MAAIFLPFSSLELMGRAKKQSFSLVELLIAVQILGALAAIAIPKLTGSSQTTKVNVCTSNIKIINKQIELYYINTGLWPNNLTKVTKDTDYFPDGEPTCPVTGDKYPNVLLGTNRVDDTGLSH